jgi:hypothetical protein
MILDPFTGSVFNEPAPDTNDTATALVLSGGTSAAPRSQPAPEEPPDQTPGLAAHELKAILETELGSQARRPALTTGTPLPATPTAPRARHLDRVGILKLAVLGILIGTSITTCIVMTR